MFKSATKKLKDTLLDGGRGSTAQGSLMQLRTNQPLGTATPPQSDVGIRDVINSYGKQYGISDSMIGWNQGDQMVQLGGQNLIKANSVQDGRSFANEDAIKAAIDRYAQSNGMAYKPTTPQTYQSQYQPKIDALYNALMNKGNFSYNPENDPVYQSLKTQYGQAGDKALANTMGEASALTGGRLNSWAVSAGQQAKSGFDQQLMSQIPALEANAYSRYQGDVANQQQLLNAIMAMDSEGYNRFSNDRNFGYNQFNDQRTFNRGVLESDRNFNFQKETDKRNFDFQKSTDQRDYNRGVLESDRAFNFQKEQQAIQTALQKRQISVSEANAALNRLEFQYRQQQDAKSEQQALSKAESESQRNSEIAQYYHDMMSNKIETIDGKIIEGATPQQWLNYYSQFLDPEVIDYLYKKIPENNGSSAILEAIMNKAK